MTTPRELYNLQEIDHRIDSIDTERKRMSLSYRKVYGL